ncbi:MAG: hypothetical protein K0Q50_2780, partial [Vampirovibrio sp.]|jgi:hypothetical protein|nr:hypothetical protein [Vampirovibrio sp.]
MLVMIGAALAKHQVLLWSVMVGFMIVPLLVSRLLPSLQKAAPEFKLTETS